MKFLPKKLRNEDALKKTADGFAGRFASANDIADPADRLEAMLALKGDVSSYAADIYMRMIDRSVSIQVGGLVGALTTSVGGGIALSLVATPLVGIPVMLAGIGGTVFGAFKAADSRAMMNRMEKEMSSHLEALNGLLEKTEADIGETLKTRSNEIAASDKFDSIYDRFPEVRDSFIKTFNKAMARRELPPPPPPGSTGPKLAL